MPKILAHVHMYVRAGQKRESKFMCAHPDCTHREERKYLKGKRSLCNKCGEEFLLDSYALGTSKPKCIKCRNVKKDKKEKKLLLQSFEQLNALKEL